MRDKKLYWPGRSSQSGGIMVFFALLMPVLLGCLGLAIDVSLLYATHGKLQNVADASALAGAQYIHKDTYEQAATTYAKLNGVAATGVKVQLEDANGAVTQAAKADRLRVYISQNVAPVFMGLFGFHNIELSAVAVAKAGSTGTDANGSTLRIYAGKQLWLDQQFIPAFPSGFAGSPFSDDGEYLNGSIYAGMLKLDKKSEIRLNGDCLAEQVQNKYEDSAQLQFASSSYSYRRPTAAESLSQSQQLQRLRVTYANLKADAAQHPEKWVVLKFAEANSLADYQLRNYVDSSKQKLRAPLCLYIPKGVKVYYDVSFIDCPEEMIVVGGGSLTISGRSWRSNATAEFGTPTDKLVTYHKGIYSDGNIIITGVAKQFDEVIYSEQDIVFQHWPGAASAPRPNHRYVLNAFICAENNVEFAVRDTGSDSYYNAQLWGSSPANGKLQLVE